MHPEIDTVIPKPEPARCPGLVDNESFWMTPAAGVGLDVAAVEPRVTADPPLPHLVVERYDRDRTSDPVRRLRQEDFAQALGVPADRKYQAAGGPGIADCIDLLRSVAA